MYILTLFFLFSWEQGVGALTFGYSSFWMLELKPLVIWVLALGLPCRSWVQCIVVGLATPTLGLLCCQRHHIRCGVMWWGSQTALLCSSHCHGSWCCLASPGTVASDTPGHRCCDGEFRRYSDGMGAEGDKGAGNKLVGTGKEIWWKRTTWAGVVARDYSILLYFPIHPKTSWPVSGVCRAVSWNDD